MIPVIPVVKFWCFLLAGPEAIAAVIKQQIERIVHQALDDAFRAGQLPSSDFPAFVVEEPNVEAHGDFSTNAAMVMASIQKMAPRKIAGILVEHLQRHPSGVKRIDIAGPGFINFYLSSAAWHPVVRRIAEQGGAFGASDVGRGRRVQVEFVSSNPTGPLHVGHGRGAAVGDAVAAILAACGYDVQREYYINDSGRQIHTLGQSVYLRLREHFGRTVDFPETCYQGDYIRELAAEIAAAEGKAALQWPEDQAIRHCARYACEKILAGIRRDLGDFGVTFDRWFSEQSLYDNGQVDESIAFFRERGLIYEKDGALWFKTSAFGDEKDRVVVRSNGQTTYFASDIAYHQDKFRRGFDRVIDVWGADHHGYIARMTAAVEAGGIARERFGVILVQLVNLLRGGEPVAMSTRAGRFDTLAQVIREVGRDAARFIFLSRHHESALDFDLELARQKTNDNPVFYVQYVHARISSILRKAREQGMEGVAWDADAVAQLTAPEETALIKAMDRFPDTVSAAAEMLEPHRITYYLMNLASLFHAYYNKHRVLTDDARLSRGRLCLVLAVRQVIRNGLTLLGVSAPEKM